MTTAVAESLADLVTLAHSNQDLVHYWCCSPDVALCGVDLMGHRQVDESTDAMCKLCEYLCTNQMPCASAQCPERIRF